MTNESEFETYVVNMDDVPVARNLDEREGWIRMQVQFAIDANNGGAEAMTFGRTVFPPGARHEWHRHHSAEEMQYIVAGEGVILSSDEEIPVKEGDITLTKKGEWHGFRNTSETEDAVMLWVWGGAGSRDVGGYEPRASIENE